MLLLLSLPSCTTGLIHNCQEPTHLYPQLIGGKITHKMYFARRRGQKRELISFLLTLPYNHFFGGETVEDNPWMDMSLCHVC